jgi:hypothetical protein
MKFKSLLIASFVFPASLFAQSTFDEVHAIFQLKCTAGCHSGGSPSGQLNLSGTTAEVYQRLININPINPAANTEGYKLVDPGYPDRSFLFRKVAHDIDPGVDYLTNQMGNLMPDGQPQLIDEQIELIRQWILWGAGDTNHYVNPQVLADYYNGPGLPRFTPLAPPAPSEGYQIHYGPFFVLPGTEQEVFYKYDTRMLEAKEVYRVKTEINEYSHHTALYKYNDGLESYFNPGLRPVNSILDAAGVYYASSILGQWPNSQDLVLPEGTAFTWLDSTVLDINYHIPNYNDDSILAAEIYMNVYTQAMGIAQTEMLSSPVYYGGSDPLNLHLLPTATDTTLVINQFEVDTAYTHYIWSIMAHTHARGKKFDIWMRTANGEKGEHIYDGNYNVEYTFNQGYYDWAHPPFRMFDPLQPVDFTNGLIHEAVFNNPGPDTINFGLSTRDEMYVSYIQYTTEPITISVKEEESPFNYFNVYPNPSRDIINLSFNSENATQGIVRLVDYLGREVYSQNISITQGKQKLQLSQQALGLSSGFYSLSLSNPEGTQNAKLVFE